MHSSKYARTCLYERGAYGKCRVKTQVREKRTFVLHTLETRERFVCSCSDTRVYSRFLLNGIRIIENSAADGVLNELTMIASNYAYGSSESTRYEDVTTRFSSTMSCTRASGSLLGYIIQSGERNFCVCSSVEIIAFKSESRMFYDASVKAQFCN